MYYLCMLFMLLTSPGLFFLDSALWRPFSFNRVLGVLRGVLRHMFSMWPSPADPADVLSPGELTSLIPPSWPFPCQHVGCATPTLFFMSFLGDSTFSRVVNFTFSLLRFIVLGRWERKKNLYIKIDNQKWETQTGAAVSKLYLRRIQFKVLWENRKQGKTQGGDGLQQPDALRNNSETHLS